MISTFHHQGGAAIAANRLLEILRKKNQVSYITKASRNQSSITSFSYEDDAFLGKLKSFLFLALEKLLFLFSEKDSSVRFSFSTAPIGFDVTKNNAFQEADIIHLHWINQGFISLNGLDKILKSGKPVVITMHDFWYFTGGCHYPGPCTAYLNGCGNCPFLRKPHNVDLSATLHAQKTAVFKHARKLTIVGCSQWLGTEASRSSILKKFHVTSIPNALPVEDFIPHDTMSMRLKYQLPSDKKILLFGSMNIQDPRKGFQYFKNALTHLAKQHTSDTLEIAVFGAIKNNVSEAFNHLPFKVNYLGKINPKDVAEIYSVADAYISPSLEDNLPNTVAEAMSCGVPVVAFHTGGLPEMIDHKKNGYLAAYKNEIDLADGIHFIISHEYPDVLKLNARNKALDKYLPEKISGAYESVYRNLL
jgi:glycosyltransferase involved in cell wall biosynthesis